MNLITPAIAAGAVMVMAVMVASPKPPPVSPSKADPLPTTTDVPIAKSDRLVPLETHEVRTIPIARSPAPLPLALPLSAPVKTATDLPLDPAKEPPPLNEKDLREPNEPDQADQADQGRHRRHPEPVKTRDRGDVCQRHGGYKVELGRGWRCRFDHKHR